MAKKLTPKNFTHVLDKIHDFYVDEISGTGASEKDFLHQFDVFLDSLADQDIFGTEQQLDPRGDQRK